MIYIDFCRGKIISVVPATRDGQRRQLICPNVSTCSLARTYLHPRLSRAIIRAIRLLDGRSMRAY